MDEQVTDIIPFTLTAVTPTQAARNPEGGATVVQRIRQATGNPQVERLLADLGDQDHEPRPRQVEQNADPAAQVQPR